MIPTDSLQVDFAEATVKDGCFTVHIRESEQDTISWNTDPFKNVKLHIDGKGNLVFTGEQRKYSIYGTWHDDNNLVQYDGDFPFFNPDDYENMADEDYEVVYRRKHGWFGKKCKYALIKKGKVFFFKETTQKRIVTSNFRICQKGE